MSSPTPLQSFVLFPLLPIELRHQIWAYAIDSIPSRIIDLHRTLHNPTPHDPLPALLQTDHESRSLALKNYLRWPRPLRTPGSWVYVSQNRDIFIVRLRKLWWKEAEKSTQQSKNEIYRKIRHIAMHQMDWQRHLWHLYTKRAGGRPWAKRALGLEEQLLDRFMALETMDIIACGEVGRNTESLQLKDVTERDIMLNFFEGYRSTVVLMTGEEALKEVKTQIEGWKVPVLRAVGYS